MFGCLRCSRKAVIHSGNGICRDCLNVIFKRLRKVEAQLKAKQPDVAQDLNQMYLRPYHSARELLRDLAPRSPKFPKPPKINVKLD